MPKTTGPIGYIEHRSPMKDETGEYLIHPQFVAHDVYDFKDMKKGMRSHHQMSPSQFVTAIEAIQDEVLYALSQGKEVKIGEMFVVRPRLEVRRHTDDEGKEWRKTYHEGDLIPAKEVACSGLEVRVTKALNREFLLNHCEGFGRVAWMAKMPPRHPSQEQADIISYCREHDFITVKDLCSLHGVSKHHARKVLEAYCGGDTPMMTREQVGRAYIYRMIAKE